MKGNSPLKVLVFMEATVVNGAAKTLLNFCDTVGASSPQPLEITIATFFRGVVAAGRPATPFIEAVQSRGLRAIVIPERYRFDPQSLATLRNVVRQQAPDIVQTNSVKSHAMIKFAGLHRDFTWLAFHHGYTAPDFKMKLYNQLDRWSLPSADQVIAVCGPFRDQLTAMGVPASRIQVLHNSAAVVDPLSPELLEATKQKFGLAGEPGKILVSIGRLSYEKGHADLLQSLKLLDATRGELKWKLLLVGSGPEESNLRELARKFNLESRIVFASHQNSVLPLYGIADLMVLPSHTEGSPHVVLEAMSAGVPIVAAAVGGVPEILTSEETALLTPPRDTAAMSSAIARLLDSPELARSLASNAKELLVRDFSHEAYKDHLLRVYAELLKPAELVKRSA